MSVTFDMSGNLLKVDGVISSGTTKATATGNAATVTSQMVQVTTPSLTTAGGSSQAETITLNGVTASNLAFVTYAGGTNTTTNISFDAICTSNTVTVTIYNNTSATALNGTVIFNLMVV